MENGYILPTGFCLEIGTDGRRNHNRKRQRHTRSQTNLMRSKKKRRRSAFPYDGPFLLVKPRSYFSSSRKESREQNARPSWASWKGVYAQIQLKDHEPIPLYGPLQRYVALRSSLPRRPRQSGTSKILVGSLAGGRLTGRCSWKRYMTYIGSPAAGRDQQT